MKTHQGYKSRDGEAKCTKCGDWISEGEDAVLLHPVEVGERGSVNLTAKSFHGLLCEPCFKDLG